ncbi:FAD-dependent oxidoreductase, partial [Sandarakinorhabdus oryzae]|uniref:FAD-dependent oxidoreductase n=1 Tax=Sandarakinorhabdus oryzae TaxID=2675220 RepID=UPI0018CC5DFB
HAQGLALPGGEILSAGLVIAATGSRAPDWLAGSGLATADGFVAVDATLASITHPNIFAAGDIIARQDRPLPRSGIHAVKAGPVLAANIGARLSGTALAEYQPPARNLYLMSTGDRRAILSWGPFGLSGRPIWWLKDRIDRGFMRRQQP